MSDFFLVPEKKIDITDYRLAQFIYAFCNLDDVRLEFLHVNEQRKISMCSFVYEYKYFEFLEYFVSLYLQ